MLEINCEHPTQRSDILKFAEILVSMEACILTQPDIGCLQYSRLFIEPSSLDNASRHKLPKSPIKGMSKGDFWNIPCSLNGCLYYIPSII